MAARRVRTAAAMATVAAILAVTLAGCSGSKAGSNRGTASTVAGATTTTEPPGLQGQPTTIDKVAVGQCANDVPDVNQRLFAVLLIGCEQRHTYEVYFQFRYPAGAAPLPGGSPYPGETVVRKASETECYNQFEAWMGSPWTVSNFDIQTWWPSKVSWNSINDRHVTCAGYLLSGKKSIGSARGTKG